MDVSEDRTSPRRTEPAGPIVLVGLSGAGKTEVGRRLARHLGWDLLDLDAEIERVAGRSIRAIFEAHGERRFRDLESRVTLSAAPDPETVIATGGGWMARPELRDVWPDARRVWLRVSPGVAIERLAKEPLTRPLLAGPDPESALEALLASRLQAYALSEYSVDTDGRDVEQIVREVLGLLGR